MRGGGAPAVREGQLQGAEGELYLRIWDAPAPRGAVQLCHGLSQHVGMYDHVAARLVEAGWTVVGHDLIGHGRSEGPRGVLRRFDALVEDLRTVRNALSEWADVSTPPVLLAHSLGGLVSIRMLQTGSEPFAGLVLSAPWLGTAVQVTPGRRALASVLGWMAPDFAIPNDFDVAALTRDPAMQERRRTDPLAHARISAGLYQRSQVAQQAALAGGLPHGLPTLVLLPGADEVADAEVTRGWVGKLREAGHPVETRELEGVPHEPFNDTARNEILDQLVHWMDLLPGPGLRPTTEPGGTSQQDQENDPE